MQQTVNDIIERSRLQCYNITEMLAYVPWVTRTMFPSVTGRRQEMRRSDKWEPDELKRCRLVVRCRPNNVSYISFIFRFLYSALQLLLLSCPVLYWSRMWLPTCRSREAASRDYTSAIKWHAIKCPHDCLHAINCPAINCPRLTVPRLTIRKPVKSCCA